MTGVQTCALPISDQFVKFEISYNNSAINKLLFTSIKRNAIIDKNTELLSDKKFFSIMKKEHIRLTQPTERILKKEYADVFMENFLLTKMGQMVKIASSLKINLQKKYKEERYLLEELLK